MTREQAIHSMITHGFKVEQVGEIVKAVTPQFSSELEKNSKKLEKDFCELDCIDRAELLKAIDTWDKFGCDADTKLVPYQDHYIPYIHYDDVIKCIKSMPSVTPQEPRKGHWIKGYTFPDGAYWKCDKCNELIKVKFPMNYCNNCGADMREVKE